MRPEAAKVPAGVRVAGTTSRRNGTTRPAMTRRPQNSRAIGPRTRARGASRRPRSVAVRPTTTSRATSPAIRRMAIVRRSRIEGMATEAARSQPARWSRCTA
jgi:hypothetical protein